VLRGVQRGVLRRKRGYEDGQTELIRPFRETEMDSSDLSDSDAIQIRACEGRVKAYNRH